MKLGLAFILGGGLSNMIDRIFYGKSFFENPWTIFEESFWQEIFHGYVVDMFDFCGIWNAIFNVADSFVCVGAALVICTLLFDLLVNKSEERKAAETKASDLNEKMNGESKDGVLLPENEDATPIIAVETDKDEQENEEKSK